MKYEWHTKQFQTKKKKCQTQTLKGLFQNSNL